MVHPRCLINPNFATVPCRRGLCEWDEMGRRMYRKVTRKEQARKPAREPGGGRSRCAGRERSEAATSTAPSAGRSGLEFPRSRPNPEERQAQDRINPRESACVSGGDTEKSKLLRRCGSRREAALLIKHHAAATT